VRRILFDENLPRQLRRDLPEFTIRTVQEEDWGAYQNGQLLRLAETAFDVLLTADRRMEYQQNLASFSIGIVVINTPRLRLQELRSVLGPLREALAHVRAGEIIRISVE
jgi:predicted nuclease of predicted toxin-antitoxin system